jgi:hypothetical protein
MSTEQGGYSPREIKKLEKQREKSDVELMKDGAKLNENGELVVTESQWARAYEEMKREIDQKTIEENVSWLKRHPEEVGTALSFLSMGSFGALAAAGQAEMMPDIINNLPTEAMYAIVTIQAVGMAAGAILAGMGKRLSEKWGKEALAKADEDKDIKEKLRNARKKQDESNI